MRIAPTYYALTLPPHLPSAVIRAPAPLPGEQLVVNLFSWETLQLGFDPASIGSIHRSGDDLRIVMDTGGAVTVEDFLRPHDSDEPDVILPDGSRLALDTLELMTRCTAELDVRWPADQPFPCLELDESILA